MTRLQRRAFELARRATDHFNVSAAHIGTDHDMQWHHHTIASRLLRKRSAALAKMRLRGDDLPNQ